MKPFRAFIDLLGRFLAGSATPKENELIDKWYSRLESENNYPKLDQSDADELHRQDFENIRTRIRKPKMRITVLWPSLAAAAVVVFGIIYIYIISSQPLDSGNNDTMAHVPMSRMVLDPNTNFYNSSAETKEIWLIDSSRILLQPKSLISISSSFNQKERNIEFEGQALFEIKRNENKPFQVFTYGVVTKVLGTSFEIKAPSKNERIIVAVKTGKVSVMKNFQTQQSKRDREVILTANQQVTFNPEKEMLEASLVAKPVPIVASTKLRNEYDEEPITNILSDIEEQYGVKINYVKETLKNCKITTAFENEDIYQRLDILTKAIGATYSIQGIEISIQSNGCRIK